GGDVVVRVLQVDLVAHRLEGLPDVVAVGDPALGLLGGHGDADGEVGRRLLAACCRVGAAAGSAASGENQCGRGGDDEERERPLHLHGVLLLWWCGSLVLPAGRVVPEPGGVPLAGGEPAGSAPARRAAAGVEARAMRAGDEATAMPSSARWAAAWAAVATDGAVRPSQAAARMRPRRSTSVVCAGPTVRRSAASAVITNRSVPSTRVETAIGCGPEGAAVAHASHSRSRVRAMRTCRT